MRRPVCALTHFEYKLAAKVAPFAQPVSFPGIGKSKFRNFGNPHRTTCHQFDDAFEMRPVPPDGRSQ